MSSKGRKSTMPRKQEAAIAALLRRPSIAAAAHDIGVSEKTLREWMKTPEFQSAYREAANQILHGSMKSLHALTVRAVGTLRRAMRSADLAIASRAAKSVFDISLKAHEMLSLQVELADLHEQIRRLEEESAAGRAACPSPALPAPAWQPTPASPPTPAPQPDPSGTGTDDDDSAPPLDFDTDFDTDN